MLYNKMHSKNLHIVKNIIRMFQNVKKIISNNASFDCIQPTSQFQRGIII